MAERNEQRLHAFVQRTVAEWSELCGGCPDVDKLVQFLAIEIGESGHKGDAHLRVEQQDDWLVDVEYLGIVEARLGRYLLFRCPPFWKKPLPLPSKRYWVQFRNTDGKHQGGNWSRPTRHQQYRDARDHLERCVTPFESQEGVKVLWDGDVATIVFSPTDSAIWRVTEVCADGH